MKDFYMKIIRVILCFVIAFDRPFYASEKQPKSFLRSFSFKNFLTRSRSDDSDKTKDPLHPISKKQSGNEDIKKPKRVIFPLEDYHEDRMDIITRSNIPLTLIDEKDKDDLLVHHNQNSKLDSQDNKKLQSKKARRDTVSYWILLQSIFCCR